MDAVQGSTLITSSSLSEDEHVSLGDNNDINEFISRYYNPAFNRNFPEQEVFDYGDEEFDWDMDLESVPSASFSHHIATDKHYSQQYLEYILSSVVDSDEMMLLSSFDLPEMCDKCKETCKSSIPSDVWLLDSGASSHFTYQLGDVTLGANN